MAAKKKKEAVVIDQVASEVPDESAVSRFQFQDGLIVEVVPTDPNRIESYLNSIRAGLLQQTLEHGLYYENGQKRRLSEQDMNMKVFEALLVQLIQEEFVRVPKKDLRKHMIAVRKQAKEMQLDVKIDTRKWTNKAKSQAIITTRWLRPDLFGVIAHIMLISGYDRLHNDPNLTQDLIQASSVGAIEI
jgi:hypothetical protein